LDGGDVDESDFVPFINNYNSSSCNNTPGMMLMMTNVSQISSSSPSLAQHPSFLVYNTHSGFSNQLMGLQKAVQFAHATGRILVLSNDTHLGKSNRAAFLVRPTKERTCFNDMPTEMP
jgi:hypothetical protein